MSFLLFIWQHVPDFVQFGSDLHTARMNLDSSMGGVIVIDIEIPI